MISLVYANGVPTPLDSNQELSATEQGRSGGVYNQLNPKRQIHELQNAPVGGSLQENIRDIQNRIDDIYRYIADFERDKGDIIQGFYDKLLTLLALAIALVTATGIAIYRFVVRKILQDVRVNGQLESHRLLYGIYMNLVITGG